VHPEPATFHDTAVFEAPETDTANCCFELVGRFTPEGVTATAITGVPLPTCNCTVFDTWLNAAVRVTIPVGTAEDRSTSNAALVCPAGTTTHVGTDTPERLLAR
jgi:hypothetical protein